MGIESEIAKADLLSLWRQFKGERENFYMSRDRIYALIKTIESAGFSDKADITETALLASCKSDLEKIGAK